jgi:predicted nucleic-acid-binding protein
MLAIDTNVVVRYLTGDHPQQSLKARALIDAEAVFVSSTVLLETEWVLRGVYGFAPDTIAAAFRAFAGLPNVAVDEPALIVKALDWTTKGMDFADALHLAKAEGCGAWATFDRRFAKIAKKASGIEVRLL